MKFPALLLAGVMVSCSLPASAVVRMPVPRTAALVSVYVIPAESRPETLALAQRISQSLPGVWSAATLGRSHIFTVTASTTVPVDVYVVVYNDILKYMRGDSRKINGNRVVNIFDTDATPALRTLLHELGHALGCCGGEDGVPGHVTEGCDNGRGPIMCPFNGDAPTFNDYELGQMGL